jgi:hypothetical protein
MIKKETLNASSKLNSAEAFCMINLFFAKKHYENITNLKNEIHKTMQNSGNFTEKTITSLENFYHEALNRLNDAKLNCNKTKPPNNSEKQAN